MIEIAWVFGRSEEPWFKRTSPPMFDTPNTNLLAAAGGKSNQFACITDGIQAYGLSGGIAGLERFAASGAIGAAALNGTSFTVGGTTLIQGGTTSLAEINEVNNLLSRSEYDRDQITGNRSFTNYTFNSWLSSNPLSSMLAANRSANESGGLDRGDFLTNAIHVGQVVYRAGANINGSIGYSFNGIRDSDDYFGFDVGKSGRINISLTGLSQNVGIALYNTSGSLLAFSDRASNLSESINLDLNVGAYVVRAYSLGQAPWNHGATNYTLGISRSADALEAYWQNMLVDSSVENAALNAIKTDSSLSRADVIGILRSAGDFGSVTETELTDLRNFYNNAINAQNVAADVKTLAGKVVFSDNSNQWYTGSDSIRDNLGDLAAGSSTTQLNLLIGKHFLGTDRPAIHRDASNNLVGSYTTANGSLFVGGASAADIVQGATGDCYYLAALASTAHEKTSIIGDMFRDNGDGTWSVRFFTNGKTDYVTVDRMMATNSWGNYIYANAGQSVAANNELWVALAEKAYAQVNESGRIGQDGTNFYGNGNDNGIGWGFDSAATRHITGLNASSSTTASFTQTALINLINSNKVVTISGFNNLATNSNAGETQISTAVQGHVYAITGYNSATGRFSIRNPWGSQHLSLTYSQLLQLNGWISSTDS